MTMRRWLAGLTILAVLGGFASRALGQGVLPSAIQIIDAAICQQVVNREPVGINDVFPKSVEKLYCFTHIVGATGNTLITHNWYYNGKLQASVLLPVNSGNWRTFSSKTIPLDMAGEWMVEVLSKEGVPLESLIFNIR